MNAKDIPNLISIFRIFLVAPIVWLTLEGRAAEALTLFVLAGASDALDGHLARRYGWRSRLGSILDPLADKLLMMSVFVTLGWLEIAPLWLVVAVLIRDIVILLGGAAYHFMIGQYSMAPSLLSKTNTSLQIVLVTAFMVGQLWGLPEVMMTALIYAAMTTTVLSGLNYMWVWGVRAWRAHHDMRASQ
jgi:cardiolipin synthase